MQVGKVLGTLVLARSLVACGGLVPSDLFDSSDGGVVLPADGAPSVMDAHSGGDASSRETSVTPTADATSPPPVGDDSGTDLPDAGEPEDTGTPSSTAVACGTSSCSGNAPVCCVTITGQQGQQQASSSCVASNSDCSASGSVPIECGSSADCSNGATCCVEFSANRTIDQVSCNSSCGGSGLAVCQPNGPSGQCPNGETCMMSQFPGYGVCFGGGH